MNFTKTWSKSCKILETLPFRQPCRPVTQQIVQLQQSFHEQLSLRKLEADSASSSSNVTPEPEVPQEAKEQRSKATFLNWTQAGQTRKDPKNKWKKGLALARSLKSKGKVVGKTAQKSGPGLAADSRVYVDLMGRQKVESEASEVHSEQSEGSEGSEGSESEGSGLSGVSEPELAPSTPATKRVLVPPAPLETVPRTPVANRTPRLVVGEAPSSPVTPTGEICRGRRLVSSTRVQRVQLEVKVEGVKVGRPVAEDVRNVLDDESCATSSEGVPEEGGDTPVAKMRTPTLVTRRSSSFPDMANPFLLLDDTVDLEDKVQKEPQSDDTKERSEKDAHPNPELSPRSPGSRGSPYRFVRSPSPAQSDSPHKGHSRQSGDSPGLSSPGQSMNTESTRWFLNVMEMEQRQAKLQAEKMPKTGRAFPSQNASYSCSGPPGTARRLQLHPRQGRNFVHFLLCEENCATLKTHCFLMFFVNAKYEATQLLWMRSCLQGFHPGSYRESVHSSMKSSRFVGLVRLGRWKTIPSSVVNRFHDTCHTCNLLNSSKNFCIPSAHIHLHVKICGCPNSTFVCVSSIYRHMKIIY